jgi:hypothetical protein
VRRRRQPQSSIHRIREYHQLPPPLLMLVSLTRFQTMEIGLGHSSSLHLFWIISTELWQSGCNIH